MSNYAPVQLAGPPNYGTATERQLLMANGQLYIPHERNVDMSPNQRYALLGKTRSGKTVFGMALASILVPYDKKKALGWEAWWIDTKNDPDDLALLAAWGYQEDKGPRRLFKVRNGPRDKKTGKFTVLAWENAQEIFSKAYEQRGVLVIIDEYVQVVKSTIHAGDDLLNIFQRGGGLDVGLIGMTQEPVYVPRQLISQASHQFLFTVTYPKDIYYTEGIYPPYIPPLAFGMEHSHGFYHVATDYDGQGAYYQNQYQWAVETGLIAA